MNKRSFLKALFGGGGAGIVGIATAGMAPVPELERHHIDEHPLSVLEEFNNRFPGYQQAERVGQFSVFFSGLKPTQVSSILAGQWFAWPGAWLHVEDRKSIDRYFRADVPDCGMDGEYHLGDHFPIKGDIDTGMLMSAEGRIKVSRWVEDGHRRIVALIRSVR